MTVLKIDLDLKPGKEWLAKWKLTRKHLLEALGFKVKEIVLRSTRKGWHAWIHVEDKEIEDWDLNMLQWLCGDDQTRVKINMRRIKRGVKRWNKLFSEVIWRRKILPLLWADGEGKVIEFKKLRAWVKE